MTWMIEFTTDRGFGNHEAEGVMDRVEAANHVLHGLDEMLWFTEKWTASFASSFGFLHGLVMTHPGSGWT